MRKKFFSFIGYALIALWLIFSIASPISNAIDRFRGEGDEEGYDDSGSIIYVDECDAEDFDLHFSILADYPEYAVSDRFKNTTSEDLEDAFTKIYCYLYKEPGVTRNEAEDAKIYIHQYIEALHSEIYSLYKEYESIYVTPNE